MVSSWEKRLTVEGDRGGLCVESKQKSFNLTGAPIGLSGEHLPAPAGPHICCLLPASWGNGQGLTLAPDHFHCLAILFPSEHLESHPTVFAKLACA